MHCNILLNIVKTKFSTKFSLETKLWQNWSNIRHFRVTLFTTRIHMFTQYMHMEICHHMFLFSLMDNRPRNGFMDSYDERVCFTRHIIQTSFSSVFLCFRSLNSDLWTLISDVQFSEICWKAADSWFTCVFNSWNQDNCRLTTGLPDLDWSLDWSTDLGDIVWLIDCSTDLYDSDWLIAHRYEVASGTVCIQHLNALAEQDMMKFIICRECFLKKTWMGCTAQWTVAKDSTPSKPCWKN